MRIRNSVENSGWNSAIKTLTTPSKCTVLLWMRLLSLYIAGHVFRLRNNNILIQHGMTCTEHTGHRADVSLTSSPVDNSSTNDDTRSSLEPRLHRLIRLNSTQLNNQTDQTRVWVGPVPSLWSRLYISRQFYSYRRQHHSYIQRQTNVFTIKSISLSL